MVWIVINTVCCIALPLLVVSIQLDCGGSEECTFFSYGCDATGGVGTISFSCHIDDTPCEFRKMSIAIVYYFESLCKLLKCSILTR